MESFNDKLLSFIEKSPTPYHAVDFMKQLLKEKEYEEITIGKFSIKEGGNYFLTTGNGTTILAFQVGKMTPQSNFHLVATHTDSPTLRLKPRSDSFSNGYHMVEVEQYGGSILRSWMNRSLGIAGKVAVWCNGKMELRLVTLPKHIAMIPDLPIHLNNTVNETGKLNIKDLKPILDLEEPVEEYLQKQIKDPILSYDLTFYNEERGYAGENLLVAPRIDNLEGTYVGFSSFLESNPENHINVFVAFHNEEISSNTKQGANSTFLSDCLHQIYDAILESKQTFYEMLNHSFMVSLDNGHAVDPMHPDLYDDKHLVYLNKGPIIKEHFRYYTTDFVSKAIFEKCCPNIPFQLSMNRSDLPGGTTLGPIASSKVSIPSIDIGLSQLSMHDAMEVAGSKDPMILKEALIQFYQSSIRFLDPDHIEVK